MGRADELSPRKTFVTPTTVTIACESFTDGIRDIKMHTTQTPREFFKIVSTFALAGC
jgi:hypothetical protein